MAPRKLSGQRQTRCDNLIFPNLSIFLKLSYLEDWVDLVSKTQLLLSLCNLAGEYKYKV